MTTAAPVHVRRSWRAILPDECEALAFAKCWVSTDRSAPPLLLHPTALGGAGVHIRPGTTDAQVFDDTFVGLYHLPPAPLPESAVILDLGGNIGLTAAHFAAMHPRARVLCVEMDAGNAAMARQNLAQFGSRCQVVEAAVWNRDGWLEYSGEEEWGFAVCGTGILAVSEATTGRMPVPRRCQAMTVKSIAAACGIDQIDYAKVDIEGAEDAVVRADAGWMGLVGSIKVEYHPPATRESMRCALGGAGFDISFDTHHPRCVTGGRRPSRG